MKCRFSIRDLLWLTLVAGLGIFLTRRIFLTGRVDDFLIFAIVIPIGAIPVLSNSWIGGREAVWRGVVVGICSNSLLAVVMLIFYILAELGVIVR
jgi:hypothetical protein